MNTGFVRPAVATVLTVYGIETYMLIGREVVGYRALQQYLPFTVLKRLLLVTVPFPLVCCNSTYRLRY